MYKKYFSFLNPNSVSKCLNVIVSCVSCRNYGVPLHLIRELYETFRNFRIRVADYMRYRKITSNMNDRFPDATPDELNL